MTFPKTKKCDCGHYKTKLDEVKEDGKLVSVFYSCSKCGLSEWTDLDNNMEKNPEGNKRLEIFE